jgi:Cdc6-like AAA superfamily ATPase
MENDKFIELNKNIQEIIDLIANKNAKEAKNKLVVVSDDLDELIDHSELDEELVEISRYQVLLNQLQQKIVALNGHIE